MNKVKLDKTKLDKVTVQLSALALGVSFLSSSFAIYQWWTSGRDEKIRAAIEISNKYSDDAIKPRQLARDYEMARSQFLSGAMGRLELEKLDERFKIRKHFNRLEYVAFLANRGQIDTNYLSQLVLCDIARASDDLAFLHKSDGADVKDFSELPDKLEQINKFAKKYHVACPAEENDEDQADKGGNEETKEKMETPK